MRVLTERHVRQSGEIGKSGACFPCAGLP
jgi:hypothetical protein